MNSEIIKVIVQSLLRLITLFLWKPQRKDDKDEEQT